MAQVCRKKTPVITRKIMVLAYPVVSRLEGISKEHEKGLKFVDICF